MEIKVLKVYQGVYLAAKMKTHFNAEKDADFLDGLELELVPNVGVKASARGDSIIVPFPNVAYIQLKQPKPTEQKATKPAK